MEFIERSLILKTGSFRENDIWLRLATPSRGVLTAFAFGGSRSQKRFMGCLDPFNQVLFKFKRASRGNYLSLLEGTLLNGRPGLRACPGKLGQAANCLHFYETVHVGPVSSHQGYELLTNTLDFLDRSSHLPEMFPVFFRARLIFLQGYAPQWDVCSSCKKKLTKGQTSFFVIKQGVIQCSACARACSGTLAVSGEALAVLRNIGFKEAGQWGSISLSFQARQDVFAVIDALMHYHMGIIFENGRFKCI